MKKNDTVAIPVWVWILCVLSLLGASTWVFQACGAGKTTCQVIDVAKMACDTLPIRYLGPDGKEHVVEVPKSLLERSAEAHRLAQQQDSGVDGGADQ